MISVRNSFFAFCLVLLLPARAFADSAEAFAAPSLVGFPKSVIEIATPDAKVQRFNVWVADTEPHREQGLMFVKFLAEDSGMLFVYSQPRQISMWMKNTLIPLDMLFVDAHGRVQQIIANARPLSLDILSSKKPAQWVIELNGGAAEAHGITAGARVRQIPSP